MILWICLSYSGAARLQVLPPADLEVVLLDEKTREHNLQPLRLQVTSDVTQVTLREYWSMIPTSRQVDDFNTVINIQYTDKAIREVGFLDAHFNVAGDVAMQMQNPTFM